MAYFLGRDVIVAVTSENTTNGFDNNAGVATVAAGPNSTDNQDVFKRDGVDLTAGTGIMKDLTGVEVSLGAIDEDIAYMGQRTALKAEIKKETTVTLTRKKSDAFWSDMWATGYRWGCTAASTDEATTVAVGNAMPASTEYGFRVHVALKDNAEVITVSGMTFSEYSTTLNADGVTEETLTFISHITPKVSAAEDTGTAQGSAPFLF